jgi:hypothetical protein
MDYELINGPALLAGVIIRQISNICSINSILDLGIPNFLKRLAFTIAQRFSIGFKSGDCGPQS